MLLASPAGENENVILKPLEESGFYEGTNRGITYYRKSDPGDSIFDMNYAFREFVKPVLNYKQFKT